MHEIYIADEDECSLDQHKCDQFARCVNQHGGYDCVCESGFTGDGFSCEGRMTWCHSLILIHMFIKGEMKGLFFKS